MAKKKGMTGIQVATAVLKMKWRDEHGERLVFGTFGAAQRAAAAKLVRHGYARRRVDPRAAANGYELTP